MSLLGSLLKHVVNGMESIREQISRSFMRHKKGISGRALRLPDSQKMLQSIMSSQPTFICIDTLDQGVVVHRAKILYALKQILEESQDTRIFTA